MTSETYDANGSPTVVGSVTYKWDGENRLVRYTNPSTNTSSSFVYDGLSRLVRVVDANTQTGTITADHSYLWCGANRCLAHNNVMGGAVSTQYFAQGEILSGTGYYYVTDQLGSIEQLVNASGTIVTQYAYDPYGNQSTVVGGTVASDFGYAGYFNHAASGLSFALHRAYDPVHARWLNRDPIGESGGINLYAYVGGNPLNGIDPLGYCGALDTLFSPWGGWSNFLQDVAGISNYDWPGDSVAASLAGITPVGAVEGAAAEALSPEVAATFSNGEYTAITLAEDLTAFRYSGGTTPNVGRFLTTSDTVAQISSGVSASIALNLPANATAATLNVFTIPAGTTIFMGGVAGGAESAIQIFIQDASVLIPK
jgi:RHS repeat-associated protein